MGIVFSKINKQCSLNTDKKQIVCDTILEKRQQRHTAKCFNCRF